ncbi:tRNA(m5U54)methyltransferase [Loxospora ochrophaea]|nr:tRNA(m5U54)methyltransferase [Loxospora ochrophaea]
MTRKKHYQGFAAKRRKVKPKAVTEGSNEEILLADVRNLLGALSSKNAENEGNEDEETSKTTLTSHTPPERFTQVEVEIVDLSSTGDGLGFSLNSDHVYVVPFTAPGDVVQAKTVTYVAQHNYTLTDFISVTKSSPRRDESLIRCPYFSRCSGCQFQMLAYEEQLIHKKQVVEKAFRNFSTLTPELVPPIGATVGSPMQYGYRTKLTPHFDGPPGSLTRREKRKGDQRAGFKDVPPIGFMLKGTRKTIDIEDCPIGTDALREGMKSERERVSDEIANYKKGATLLLRENTLRIPESEIFDKNTKNDSGQAIIPADAGDEPAVQRKYLVKKTCITDFNATATKYIDDFVFSNTAGAFFQNNNSILPTFTAYVRDHIFPREADEDTQQIKYLVDAYCGSGLFTVTLSSIFSSSIGIDISGESIQAAHRNAKANKISNAKFVTADAAEIFKEVTFSSDETVVVIDPPRKGCDDAFLGQLLHFGPRRIVYVSCNVHTQARDVSVLVEGKGGATYDLESLRGFDFFPQTGHVEGVAVLRRSEQEGTSPRSK